MNTDKVIAKYPDLKGLYIPERGEIIEWGTGCALVIQSPLEDDSMPPLMVFTLNMDIAISTFHGGTGAFQVRNGLCMGPWEKLSLDKQKQLVDYYNEYYNGRFEKLFARFSDAKTAWESYCAQAEFAGLIE